MTPVKVAEMIRFALSQDKDPRISSVTMDDVSSGCQLVLITDDGTKKQVWVIDPAHIIETDCPTCEGVGLVSKDGPAGIPHTVPCPKCQP